MIPAFERAVNVKAWTLAATLSIATALASTQNAQAAYIAPNSLEDYIVSDIRSNNPVLSNLDELKTLNAIGSSRATYQRYVHELNRFHAAPDNARFQSVDMFSSRQLYEMMVYGGEEFYDTSYTGVFDRFEAKMQQRGQSSLFDVVPENFRASIVPFLNQAVTYNTQDRAAATIQPSQWPEVLQHFGRRIAQGDVNAMTTLAAVGQVVDPQSQRQIETFIQRNYDQARDVSVKDAFGMTAGYYNDLAGRDAITLQNPAFYAPQAAEQLSRGDLLGRDGVHRQLMVFANNDPEAGFGFTSLIHTYQASPDYQILDYGSFIKISSLSGQAVEIFANHPSAHPNDIFTAITNSQNWEYGDVEFDAIIDRGAYDFRDNIDPYVSSANAFIYAAKNGDTYNTRVLLQNAPDAHILSTPRTGMPANSDALLFNITDSIRQTGSIDWSEQNDFLRLMGQEDSFILPSENRVLTAVNTQKEMAEIKMLGALRPMPRPELDSTPNL